MRFTSAGTLVLSLAMLGGCGPMPTGSAVPSSDSPTRLDYSQSDYNVRDVGRAIGLDFAVILSVREVNINSWQAPAVADTASYPSESGHEEHEAAALDADLAPAGGAHKGIEYILLREVGKKDGDKLISLVQNKNESDRVYKVGERVLVQTGGNYQRILPTNKLPSQVKRPVGIDLID